MKRATRKSIWDTPLASNSSSTNTTAGTDNQTHTSVEPNSSNAPPKPVVEQLRVAEEKKRNRDWERQEQNRPMLFRRVPPALRDAIKETADILQIRVDDVARAFLEYGLFCYQKGEIQIQPVLSEGRLTLFPRHGDGKRKPANPGWSENFRDPQHVAKPTRKARQSKAEKEKPWKWQVSYRGIPAELQVSLREIHQKKAVPLGEVATLFLGHALDAYRAGRLALHPQPRIASGIEMTLK